jgi:hypothetical protein
MQFDGRIFTFNDGRLSDSIFLPLPPLIRLPDCCRS